MQRRIGFEIAPFLVLAALHLVLIAGMRYPIAFYDELLYLGLARTFAGASHYPDLYSGILGHWGYSIALAPAFLFGTDFPSQYRIVLLLNTALSLVTYGGVRAMLRCATGVSHTASSWLALAACCYPSALLIGNMAASENLLLALSAWFAAWLFQAAREPSVISLSKLALVSGAAYVTHTRGSALVGAAAIMIGTVLLSRRVRPIQAIPGFLILAVFVTYTMLGKTWLEAATGFEFPRVERFSTGFENLPETVFIYTAAGHFVYLAIGTLGIYFLGLARTLRVVFVGDETIPARRHAYMILLLIHLCLVAGSIFFISMMRPLERGDHLLIGRYTEAFLLPLLALGLAETWELAEGLTSNRVTAFIATVAWLIVFAGSFVIAPAFPWNTMNGPTPRLNALAVMPWFRLLDQLDLPSYVGGSGAVLGLALFIRKGRHAAALLLLVALGYAGGALYYLRNDVLATQGLRFCSSPGDCSPSSLVAELRATRCANDVVVHNRSWDAFTYSSWQLFIPEKRFRVGRNPPEACLYIAPHDWDGAAAGYQRGLCELQSLACVWRR